MPPLTGDAAAAAQALRSGSLPGGLPSDGAASLQMTESAAVQQEAPQTDFIQKLLNKEIPIPSEPKAAKAPSYIRLRGLPYEASEQDILAWMAKHEVVDQIVESRQAVRVYNKNNGKPMGVAVVALNSKEDADYVLEVLNGQYMKNRYIEVFHHMEGEAGTDKAFVQGNSSQAKTELSEASKFEGLGDTGGSGGFGNGGWHMSGLTGARGGSNPQTDPSWESVLDFLKSDGNFGQASLQHPAGSEKQSSTRPGLRIDSM